MIILRGSPLLCTLLTSAIFFCWQSPPFSIKPMDSFTPSAYEDEFVLPGSETRDDANSASSQANQEEQDSNWLGSKEQDLNHSDANNNGQSADGIQDPDQLKDGSDVVTDHRSNKSQAKQDIIDHQQGDDYTTEPVPSQELKSGHRLRPRDRRSHVTPTKSRSSLNFRGNGMGTISRAEKSSPHSHSQIMMESPASALSSFRTKKRSVWFLELPQACRCTLQVLIQWPPCYATTLTSNSPLSCGCLA